MLNKAKSSMGKLFTVVKYEILNTSRIFVPLYSVLVIVSLLGGFLFYGENSLPILNGQYTMNINGVETVKTINGMGFLFGSVFIILTTVAFAITLFLLISRFSKSMLGDEAYLNMTLPLTLGQQIWGRVICSFLWVISCSTIISLASAFIHFRKKGTTIFNINYSDFAARFAEYYGINFVWMIISLLVTVICLIMTFIFFGFFISALSHLFKKNRGITKIFMSVILFIVYCNILRYVFSSIDYKAVSCAPMVITWTLTGINTVISLIYIFTTQFILATKLNLE